MSNSEEKNKSEGRDIIAEVGEKHLPGKFKSKFKVSEIWGTTALIIGTSMMLYSAFNISNTPEKPSTIAPLQEVKVTSDTEIPKPLLEKSDQVKVLSSFATEIKGINGWVIEGVADNADKTIIYSSADGKAIFIGGIVGENDANLTTKHFDLFIGSSKSKKEVSEPTSKVKKQAPLKKESIDLSNMQGVLDSQPVVTIGKGDKELTIVIDLNCPYCHQYYQSLVGQSDLLGEFTIHLMPVGILGMDSVHKAAMFEGLPEHEALELLKALMNGSNGSITPTETAIANSMKRSQQWSNAGLNVVPLTLFDIDNPTDPFGVAGVLSKAQLKSAFNL